MDQLPNSVRHAWFNFVILVVDLDHWYPSVVGFDCYQEIVTDNFSFSIVNEVPNLIGLTPEEAGMV